MVEVIPFLQDYLPDFNVKGPDIEKQLSSYINELIITDFQKLLFVLYRLDINESQLQLLISQEKDQTAGDIIARMIIKRELQKIESRKKYKSFNTDSEEEKW